MNNCPEDLGAGGGGCDWWCRGCQPFSSAPATSGANFKNQLDRTWRENPSWCFPCSPGPRYLLHLSSSVKGPPPPVTHSPFSFSSHFICLRGLLQSPLSHPLKPHRLSYCISIYSPHPQPQQSSFLTHSYTYQEQGVFPVGQYLINTVFTRAVLLRLLTSITTPASLLHNNLIYHTGRDDEVLAMKVHTLYTSIIIQSPPFPCLICKKILGSLEYPAKKMPNKMDICYFLRLEA